MSARCASARLVRLIALVALSASCRSYGGQPPPARPAPPPAPAPPAVVAPAPLPPIALAAVAPVQRRLAFVARVAARTEAERQLAPLARRLGVPLDTQETLLELMVRAMGARLDRADVGAIDPARAAVIVGVARGFGFQLDVCLALPFQDDASARRALGGLGAEVRRREGESARSSPAGGLVYAGISDRTLLLSKAQGAIASCGARALEELARGSAGSTPALTSVEVNPQVFGLWLPGAIRMALPAGARAMSTRTKTGQPGVSPALAALVAGLGGPLADLVAETRLARVSVEANEEVGFALRLRVVPTAGTDLDRSAASARPHALDARLPIGPDSLVVLSLGEPGLLLPVVQAIVERAGTQAKPLALALDRLQREIVGSGSCVARVAGALESTCAWSLKPHVRGREVLERYVDLTRALHGWMAPLGGVAQPPPVIERHGEAVEIDEPQAPDRDRIAEAARRSALGGDDTRRTAVMVKDGRLLTAQGRHPRDLLAAFARAPATATPRSGGELAAALAHTTRANDVLLFDLPAIFMTIAGSDDPSLRQIRHLIAAVPGLAELRAPLALTLSGGADGIELALSAPTATLENVARLVRPFMGTMGGPAHPALPPTAPAPPVPPRASAPVSLERRFSARYPELTNAEISIDTGMHQTDIADADVDGAQTFAVTVSGDKTARVWSLWSGRAMAVLRTAGPGSEGEITSVAVAPDGKQVAVGVTEGKIYVYRTADWRRVQTVDPRSGTILSLCYSRDGRRLAAGLWGHAGVRVFDTADYRQIFADRQYGRDVYGLAFDRLGRLAAASWDRGVRLYGPDLQLLARASFAEPAHRLAFDPRGESLLVGFLSKPVARLLRVPDLSTVRELTMANDQRPEIVAWSPDGGEIFASGSSHRFQTIGRWSREGAPLPSWSLSDNTVTRLIGLRAGALLVAAQDPLVGVLEANGRPRWRHGAAGVQFTGQDPALRTSADATVVEFTWRPGDRQTEAFDLKKLALLSPGDRPTLRPPVVAREGYALEHWKNEMDPALDGARLPVQPSETCRALAIDAAHDRFLLGCEWRLYMFARGGALLWSIRPPGSIRGAALSDDGRTAVVTLDDGTIRWLDADSGEIEVSVAFAGPGRDFVVWTPSGYFAGTTLGERILRAQGVAPDGTVQSVPLRDFALELRRPDLVSQSLR
ncbi:MAG TPA: hypothetical protein VKZ18_00970 [Polyangia bacterium]|nr:hypothetical protein [Polyangia bacterium]